MQTQSRTPIVQECLQRIRSSCVAGKGLVISISGEAGIGKSTLLSDLRNALLAENSSGAGFIVGLSQCSAPFRSNEQSQAEALQPWAEQLTQLVQSPSNHRVRGLVKDLAMAWVKFVPIVGDLIESTADTIELIHEHRSEGSLRQSDEGSALNQQQVFQQYINVLRKCVADAALVLIFDDLHWADVSTLNLLFAVARQMSDSPVIIIIAHRTVSTLPIANAETHPLATLCHELQRYNLLHSIELQALVDDDVDSLLRQRYGAAYVNNDELESFITKASAGNPLFIQSWLQSMEQSGILSPANGSVIRPLQDIPLPSTMKAVLDQALSGLSRDDKELLCYASVQGQTFGAALLSQATEQAPLKILQRLRHIHESTTVLESLGKQLVLGQETSAYRFRHSLYAEHLYQLLSQEERELLHEMCAKNTLEFWNSSDEVTKISIATELLPHAEIAGLHQLASEINVVLAQRAWMSYSKHECRQALEAAYKHQLSLSETLRDVLLIAQIHDLKAQLLLSEGDYQSAIQAQESARELYRTLGRTHDEIDMQIQVAVSYSRYSVTDQALEHARVAAEHAADAGYTAGHASALSVLGVSYETLGEFDHAIECYREAIKLADQAQAVVRSATAWSNLGRVQLVHGEDAEAYHSLHTALHMFEQASHLPGQARTLNALGIYAKDNINAEQGIEYLRRAIELNERIGDVGGQASNTTNIGIIHFEQKRFEEALECFRRSLSLQLLQHDPLGVGIAMHALGCCLDQLGSYDEAEQMHKQALENFEHMQEAMWIANAEYGYAMHFLFLRDFERCHQMLEQAKERAVAIHAEKTSEMIDTGFKELAKARSEAESSSRNVSE